MVEDICEVFYQNVGRLPGEHLALVRTQSYLQGCSMTAHRICDFVLYIAIGLLAGTSIMWLAFHTDRSGAAKIFKWLGLAANTLIVFGYTIKENRIFWKRGSFWWMMSLLLFVHLSVFVTVLCRIDELRPFWWIVIIPMESVVVGIVLVVTGHRADKSAKR
jgi:hypothetical protein